MRPFTQDLHSTEGFQLIAPVTSTINYLKYEMASTTNFSNKHFKVSLVGVFLFAAIICVAIPWISGASSSTDSLAVCLRNCAQCKKMFGKYFAGQLCAEACVQFKGRLIPECTDMTSIAPYLSNAL